MAPSCAIWARMAVLYRDFPKSRPMSWLVPMARVRHLGREKPSLLAATPVILTEGKDLR
jgi:hypothetical protein